jgi:hypothetical protein
MKEAHRKRWMFGPAAVLVALVVVCFFDPVATRFFPRCLLHATTGLHCPGCGSSRALHALAHGNVVAALGLNALTVLALPVWALAVWRGSAARWKPIWIWTLLFVVVLYGVLRNIPAYPFTLLAPTT